MDMQNTDIEPVTITTTSGLDTWNRPRSSEELRSFISTRHDILPDDIELF